VPSRQSGAPSLCGVAPSLSSCGMLPPFPRHPVTQTANRIVMMIFMGFNLCASAHLSRNHARVRVFGIVAAP
jgi:hypothetical protein